MQKHDIYIVFEKDTYLQYKLKQEVRVLPCSSSPRNVYVGPLKVFNTVHDYKSLGSIDFGLHINS